MRLFLFLPLLLLAAPLGLQGQSFSEEHPLFIVDLNAFLGSSSDSSTVQLSEDLLGTWGALSTANKDLVISISQEMASREYRADRQFLVFFEGLVAALEGGHSTATLTSYLTMAERLVKGYEPGAWNTFLLRMRNFWQLNALFYSKYNSWYYDQATLTFEMADQALPEEELPMEEEPEEQDDWGTEDDWGSADDEGWGDYDGWGDDADDYDGWGPDDSTDGEEWQGGFEEEEPEDPAETEEELIEAMADVTLPLPEGPLVRFSMTNLTMVSYYDSLVIPGVEGTWMIMGGVFLGEGGTFDWEPCGMEPGEVYAELRRYAIDLGKPGLRCDDAMLHNDKNLNEPVRGVFDFKSLGRPDDDPYTFPRFKSYSNQISVKNLGEGIDFTGGFSMSGPLIYTASVLDGLCKMVVSVGGEKRFRAMARRFNKVDSTFTASPASIVMYHLPDSIFHPAIDLTYRMNGQELILQQHEGIFKSTSYNSTFFDVEIRASFVDWFIEEDSLNFDILSAKNKNAALFISHDYFNRTEFNQMSGLYRFHPLRVVANHSQKSGKMEFSVDELAERSNLPVNQLIGAMKQLHSESFITYNSTTGWIEIKEKTVHWILSNIRKQDYDNLLIPSLAPDKPNGTFLLDSGKMLIRGIEQVYVSQELDVFIRPDNNTITFEPGRNFTFDGKLYSGNLEFIGRNFSFNYENFLMDLQNIDSVQFYVRDESGSSNYDEGSQLQNKLVGISYEEGASGADSMLVGTSVTSGTLFINEPDNKAAVREAPGYPKFDGASGAYVYFDQPSVLGGAYDKSIFFEVPPFKLDSLSDTDPATIGFDGTFRTNGILPHIETKLTVQADKSLGFTYNTPAEGFPLYNTDARLFGTVFMDNRGLRATGYIDYLNSHIEAEEFVFYLDSLVADGNSVRMEPGMLAGASLPELYGQNFHMNWQPYVDSLSLENLAEPFSFYGGVATLDGKAIITTKGVRGEGLLVSDRAIARSDQIRFTESQFLARHTELDINSDVPGQPIIKGEDIVVDFDVNDNTAELSPEVAGVAAISFPFAQFKTSISKAVWDYEARTVIMTKPPEVALEDSYFYTTNPEKDSLAFFAEEAIYNIPTQQLDVQGVPFVEVVDGYVIPENGELQVLEGFDLARLENAKVVLDTLHEKHTFIQASVLIPSRSRLEGNGHYFVTTAAADTFDIEFSDFELRSRLVDRKDSAAYTYAEGRVLPEDEVDLSAGMQFKGNIQMFSYDPSLHLDGYVLMNQDEQEGDPVWIEHQGIKAEESLVLDYATLITEDGRRLTAGIHYDAESADIYANLAGNTRSPSDVSIFEPVGELRYNVELDAYEIREVIHEVEEPIGVKTFDFFGHSGAILWEGDMQLLKGTEDAKFVVGAIGKGDTKQVSYEMDALLSLQMDLPTSALNLLAEDIGQIVQALGAPLAEGDFDALITKLAHVAGERNMASWIENYNVEGYVPAYEAGRGLADFMTFSKVNLKWDPERNTWHSTGKLGLSNVSSYDLNASIDGFVELIPASFEEPEKMHLFLQLASGIWYYFYYSDNRLAVASSYGEFNSIIESKSKVGKLKPGEYGFLGTDVSEALGFVNRFRKDYLGISAPYDLGSAPTPSPAEDEEDGGGFGSPPEEDDGPDEEPVYDDGF